MTYPSGYAYHLSGSWLIDLNYSYSQKNDRARVRARQSTGSAVDNIMEWDKIKMAQQFLAHANGLHPEEAMDQDEACRLLALQDLYYECYISSFSREKLLEALDSALGGKIVIPKDVNEKKYREAYKAEAEKIRLKYQT